MHCLALRLPKERLRTAFGPEKVAAAKGEVTRQVTCEQTRTRADQRALGRQNWPRSRDRPAQVELRWCGSGAQSETAPERKTRTPKPGRKNAPPAPTEALSRPRARRSSLTTQEAAPSL